MSLRIFSNFGNSVAEIRKHRLRFHERHENPQLLPGIPTLNVQDFSRI